MERIDYIKSRRNTMVSTTILFSYYLTDSKIESISSYGTRLHIGNPENLIIVAWLIWLYFLIRYFQIFYDYGIMFYRDKFSALLKIRYISTLGVDLDSISDFGFIDKMVILIHRKNKKFWTLSVKMKDGSTSFPYFIHHTSKTLLTSDVKRLKRYLWIRVLILHPHFLEYVFPLLFAVFLPVWWYIRIKNNYDIFGLLNFVK